MIRDIHTVLAFAPNWLGDAVMATPALRALHRRWPEAQLVVAGRPGINALLRGLPWIERFIGLDKKAGWRGGRAICSDLGGAPDAAIVFPHSIRAALTAHGTGAAVRLGYNRGGRRWLLTHAPEPYRENGRITPIYMGAEYLDLVRFLGCEDDGEGLELAADPDAVEATAPRLAGDGPLVVLAPGAAFGPSKQWLPERYAAVADALSERIGARCAIVTGPGEEATRAAVIDAARRPILEADGGRPTLDTLKAAIAACDLLIGNDSGPRHIAIAFKKPVVCIMGPTSPRYSEGPYERGEVIRIDVDCGPCQQPICRTDHRCMTGIATERVVDAALRFL